jgi:catechol 2,3-dioxygenase-like lactoylglutathione lyase family enzyme
VSRVVRVTPVLRAHDAHASAQWYARLGFEIEFEHRFEPGLPLFVGLRAGDCELFVSEHLGDAPENGLVYVHVDDVDAIAADFGVDAEDMPWGMREVELADPAGNRIRIGSASD